jgi:hypothetical protein
MASVPNRRHNDFESARGYHVLAKPTGAFCNPGAGCGLA